jgi:hypothetical protein
MSAGFVGGTGTVSELTAAMLVCPGTVGAIAGRDPLGSGGSIGSSAARVEVGAVDDGRWTFCGRLASEAGAGSPVGGSEALITGGGGAAHPQSNGTSLLTRSILPS